MIDLAARIYAIVAEIPRGRVTTYGQLAAMCGMSDSRLVGDAMNASEGVPWQRVINSRGEISMKGSRGARQRELLDVEGVKFDEHGRVDLGRFGWVPDAGWLEAHGYRNPPPFSASKKKEEGDQPKLF